MIDHLLCFETEAAAMAACPAYVNNGDGKPSWDGSRCIPKVSVTMPTGKYTKETEDEPSREIMKAWPKGPHFWVAIAAADVGPDLVKLPQCRVVSDRQAVVDGRNHFVYIAPGVDPTILAKASVSPVFAGSKYTF